MQWISNVGVRPLPTNLTSQTLKAIFNPRELGLDEKSAQAACLKIVRLELMAIAEKLIDLIGIDTFIYLFFYLLICLYAYMFLLIGHLLIVICMIIYEYDRD